MYTLKSIAQRGTTLMAAIALLVGTVLPAIIPAGAAFADSLNPLTNRSLTLSSSSPGWSNTDGSGNSLYAPPNSGANGQKTGNTFDFKVSTDTSTGTNKIQAMSFQYCTTSAGHCTSPGDDTTHGTDTASTADLNLNFPSPTEVGTSDFNTVVDTTSSDPNYGAVKAVPGYSNPKNSSDSTGVYAAHSLASNFVVYYYNGTSWVQSSGWNLATSNVEDSVTPADNTGQNNYITLWQTGGLGIASGTEVKVVFFGTTDNYITNPGSGAFFVKINTYKAFTGGTPYSSTGPVTAVAPTLATSDVIDGGVTVANVMNQSIQITTKVLETMQFSVGTVDPDTLDSTGGSTGGGGTGSALWQATNDPAVTDSGLQTHGTCDPILTALKIGDAENVLPLGDQSAESSLAVAHAYATHSFWRLSSNSSAGATVYYSGHTLSNTEGDQIKAIGATAATSHPGSEQFGLSIANGDGTDHTADTPTGPNDTSYPVNYSQVANYENGADNNLTGVDASVVTDNTSGGTLNASYHSPQLAPLAPTTNYGGGAIDTSTNTTGLPTDYAFDPTSDTIPVPIATESSQVVDCVTAKMRYIANIAATTPAGIYTTKVNYIAAPQY